MSSCMTCWNVRGFNDVGKHRLLREFVAENNIGLMAIVETRVKARNKVSIQISVFRNWSVVDNYEFDDGGRIWFAWDPGQFTVTIVSKSAQAIFAEVRMATGEEVVVTMVYGYNATAARFSLWRELKNFAAQNTKPWAVFGDFNSVLGPEEHLGRGEVDVSDYRDFQQCVYDAEIFDARHKGEFLTWSNKQEGEDRIARKLDRVLINMPWLHKFPSSEVNFLLPNFSDHSPMVFTILNCERLGPYPFKFFNYWTDDSEFLEVIRTTWRGSVRGNDMYKFVQKMKRVKARLAIWRRNKFPNLNLQLKNARSQLEVAQRAIISDPSSVRKATAEKEAVRSFMNLNRAEESCARQKSRVKWLTLGDSNSAYFHCAIKERRSRNKLLSLVSRNGSQIQSQEGIAAECVAHYKSIFGSIPDDEFSTDLISDLPFHDVVTEELRAELEADVTKDEIVAALWSIGSDKAPGPDGFSAHFYKVCWAIIGDDFVRAIQNFFRTNRLLGEVNATIVAMVPKIRSATTLNDYRPISCCNVLYKCITKVLTMRMKRVVQLLVSPCQSAFVPGRVIQDNILLAHEIVHLYHRDAGTPRCTVKIDLKKAYDMVRWEAVIWVMHRFKFPIRFINWVSTCITTSKFSVSVNGVPNGYFPGARGLRQGCPMSPFLFVLVMEVLNKLFVRAASNGSFRLHPRCFEPRITHLCFADDLLAFFDGGVESAVALADILHQFKHCTGREVNKEKSQIFHAGIEFDSLEQISSVLGFQLAQLPVRYLGLPLLSKSLSYADCGPVISNIHGRLQSWKSRFLTYAGRLQLIQSVLSAMQVYWLASFVFPQRTIKEIKAIFRKFLWGGAGLDKSCNPVSWKDVCVPYSEGGLAIRDLTYSSTAAILKQVWNIISNNSSLYVRWVKANLIKSNDFWTMKEQPDTSWSWKYILRSREVTRRFAFHLIGNGNNTRFWEDNWHPLGILKHRFTDSLRYNSYLHLTAKVGNVISSTGWRVPTHLVPHIRDIYNRIDEVTVHPQFEDKLIWTPSADGLFSVRSTYHAIRVVKPKADWTRLVWFKQRIPKQSFIAWFALRSALKTRAKLFAWGVSNTANCVICGSGFETEAHLFGGCTYGSQIWTSILHMMGMVRPNLNWTDEIQWCLDRFTGTIGVVQKILFCAYIYHVWKERNRRFHGEGALQTDQVLHLILQDVRVKVQALNLQVESSPRNHDFVHNVRVDISLVQRQIKHCSWFKPEAGWAIVNTDGSLQATTAGFGSIVRDCEGEVIGAAAGSTIPSTITMHELQAVEMGITVALQKHQRRVIIATDSMAVVHLLRGPTAPPWHLISIIRRIEHLRSSFEGFRVQHVFRESNRAADFLSKLLPSHSYVEIVLSSFAEDLKKIVFEDKAGHIYDRL